MLTLSIEDIILREDKRSMSALRPFLQPDFCTRAAQFILEQKGPVLIATGFYILSCDAIETDGPPGALAIGNALSSLGIPVAYLTDHYSNDVMQGLDKNLKLYKSPIGDWDDSENFAHAVCKEFQPSLFISIERCSTSADGKYRNMRSMDISEYTAKLDPFVSLIDRSVGIGDGGNEIGMGNLSEIISGIPKLPDDPAVTKCSQLVIASVSNWGGYGLVAALSQLSGRNLLPSEKEEEENIQRCVELGAVDGYLGRLNESVDGFDIPENIKTLRLLHELVEFSNK